MLFFLNYGKNYPVLNQKILLSALRSSKQDLLSFIGNERKSATVSAAQDSILASYHFSSHAKMRGATIVASLSTINLGVSIASLPQVIFSLGTAPE